MNATAVGTRRERTRELLSEFATEVVTLRISKNTMNQVREDAGRDDRTHTYIINKILENYYVSKEKTSTNK